VINRGGNVIQHGELVYGLVLAVDIESFSRLDTLDQSLVQSRLNWVLDIAAGKASLDRDRWHRQLRGDGELAVLPAGSDVARIVADFTDHLAAALADARDSEPGEPPLRLRMAMHYGTLTNGHFGPVGHAPIVACRLLDAFAVRRTLRLASASDLVLVVSDRLYRDVVETRFHGLAPSQFRRMRVSVNGTTYVGYICSGTPRAPGYVATGRIEVGDGK
jgi:hypothetical protein